MTHQPRVLESAGNSAANARPGRQVGNRARPDKDTAGIRGKNPTDQVENAGFAGAVRSDQRGPGASPDRKAEIIDDGDAAEFLADAIKPEDGVVRHATLPMVAESASTRGCRQSNRRLRLPRVINPCGRNAISTMTPAANTT